MSVEKELFELQDRYAKDLYVTEASISELLEYFLHPALHEYLELQKVKEKLEDQIKVLSDKIANYDEDE